MERRVPSRRWSAPSKGQSPTLHRPTDEYYPLCECSERKQVVTFARPNTLIGLFGGPFMGECATCRMKREVESHVRAASWLHTEWDDEEWLDLLFKVMPKAFDEGMLPDYWYELRGYPAAITSMD